MNQQTLLVTMTGSRLDAFLASEFPERSRSGWKTLILKGLVTVNGQSCKPNLKLKENDELVWTIPEEKSIEDLPEDIPLSILHEDETIMVINKPAGLVVHPAVGNESGTLVNALLFHDPLFKELERTGIVHRLDKDTSGVMIIAKTQKAIEELQRQFKERETEKQYVALVWGRPVKSGRVETLIGRHPIHRKKQAVLEEGGREAITNYKPIERFADATVMEVKIETGRTHQIRVHMAHIQHSIVGDSVYGRPKKSKLIVKPSRQMLHAQKLTINHPESGKRLSFEAPLFDDMNQLFELLRNG